MLPEGDNNLRGQHDNESTDAAFSTSEVESMQKCSDIPTEDASVDLGPGDASAGQTAAEKTEKDSDSISIGIEDRVPKISLEDGASQGDNNLRGQHDNESTDAAFSTSEVESMQKCSDLPAEDASVDLGPGDASAGQTAAEKTEKDSDSISIGIEGPVAKVSHEDDASQARGATSTCPNSVLTHGKSSLSNGDAVFAVEDLYVPYLRRFKYFLIALFSIPPLIVVVYYLVKYLKGSEEKDENNM